MIGRGDWNRTSDLIVPNDTRYQTAPHPEAKTYGKKSDHEQSNFKDTVPHILLLLWRKGIGRWDEEKRRGQVLPVI